MGIEFMIDPFSIFAPFSTIDYYLPLVCVCTALAHWKLYSCRFIHMYIALLLFHFPPSPGSESFFQFINHLHQWPQTEYTVVATNSTCVLPIHRSGHKQYMCHP